MNAYQNIQLSFKCPKALGELQPCESNWYCDGCRKMVYDFRGMEEVQILEVFAQSGQKLCGIYDANRIKVLPQQPRWYRWAQAAVMALGVMVMNSCGFSGKDRTVTTVGIPLPPPPIDTVLMGKQLPILKKDSLVRPPKIKKLKVKFPPPIVMGDAQVLKLRDTTTVENYFVGAIETPPVFPGGGPALLKYLDVNIKDTGDFQGRVFVQFTVEEDGSIDNIKMVRSAGEIMDDRIITAIKNMPKWKPGMQSNKVCKVQYTLPISLTRAEK